MGDAINPIVIKELRQAVQSRFVVGVLCVFLLAQIVFIGIYLVIQSIDGTLYQVDFRAGGHVFLILHGVLLATCMLCIPAYTGIRLAAERSEVHVDLFYISTLRPRSIVAGKFAAAMMLAVLIFSACTPFMTFTYFLRGIDIAGIFFAIGFDLLAVAVATMIALFLAVVPANRVLKVLLGLAGFFVGLFVFFFVLSGTVAWLDDTLMSALDDPEFWLECLAGVLNVIVAVVLLFTCAVALLSPLSANRTLIVRLGITLLCILTAPVYIGCAAGTNTEWPIVEWLMTTGILASLGLLIAVSEREQWAPRVARSIPRRWWLRPIAFLFFAGAAGGVIWASLLGFGCLAALPLLVLLWPEAPAQFAGAYVQATALVMLVMLGYFYGYGLTAVLLRNTILRIRPVFTWALTLALLALGSGLPYLLTLLVQYRAWSFWDVYPWLVTDPVAGMIAIGKQSDAAGLITLTFLGIWAVAISLLNVPWFVRQMRRFRPYPVSTAPSGELLRPILSATPMDVTRTAP
jgi:hypothetical protein